MLITEVINNSDHHGAGRRMLSLALMKTPVVWEKIGAIRDETELGNKARGVVGSGKRHRLRLKSHTNLNQVRLSVCVCSINVIWTYYSTSSMLS